MNAIAMLATGTVICSFAYAATQRTQPSIPPADAAKPTQGPDSRSRMHRPRGHTMLALDGGQCTLGEPLDWFTIPHVLPPCFATAVATTHERTTTSDLDRDGKRDALISMMRVPSGQDCEYNCISLDGILYTANYGLYPSSCQLQDGDGLMRYSLSVLNGEVTAMFQPVMPTAVLQSAIALVVPCDIPLAYVNVYVAGYQDFDDDGDLDLLLEFEWNTTEYNDYQVGVVWVENTSKANPALAADINGDGVVDGKDLAVVLSAWTP